MLNCALISVFNKDGILELANFLAKKGVEILSTGGTYKYLKDNRITVTEVSDVTGFEEILDGRVKTLHPIIHGGILAIRDNEKHMKTIERKGIKPIDMVVVNLYPFFEKVKENLEFEEKVEFIDIGGPTMIRAAAKNFQDVIVLTDVNDYSDVINQIEQDGDVSFNTRRKLAGKVFNLMSAYDGAISNFLLEEEYPEYLTLSYKKSMNLRYGENPHQSAAYYTSTVEKGSLKDFEQLNGKELSYNNIKDMDIAWKVVSEFEEIACCAVKHNTPCGVAIAETVYDSYIKAYECDNTSIFGGIVAINKKIDKCTAEELVKIFLEIVIAPDFDEDALEVLKEKKNLRVIKCDVKPQSKSELAKVDGGILVQSVDNKLANELKVVTEKTPTEKEMNDLIFGMKVCKYVKSNAIVVVKDGAAKGIGGGQVNRIWPTIDALNRAGDGVVLASDAFFPFNDIVQEAAKHGIKSIIQPGGAMRDQDSIDECNKNGISMVFTAIRHFKH
ncbi:bifunctional phosphoribosylaminoimidazolecarboxamide formyltransferase/IMP cyclohydrolase [Clostridiaceae bacterium UIB06]|uniref:Bifunctional purine biosynthesis protein PurH n=1 Tax=Clostridium thailandense TaxID=2794346 RepID=A0A949WQN5_9CLOT|nr:bifunctional phosphoribosylaminoimidazolecarboxamide formyltransferase/IMP cyclohydrolase [Clostridium thailandense]MBV7272991.1 bifunctional phosphoribosylaminoimidazolecarboxamide formyltransferase/IMP cyclohydrolase [Clostridium thailandense]MCH5135655.1 bifunctional phosphoribosylaminoimidazolecarboxamide formyltransferase/IMP cyclohydrolase [Clostridiaceae bacterium UIB06]